MTRTLASGTVVEVDHNGRATLPSKDEHNDSRSDCECGGSGKFYSGGAVVNGRYTGRIGECFRCQGKGYQTAADRKRNYWYDAKYRRIHI